MADILDICQQQVGYREGAGGWTKYGAWLDEKCGTRVYATADWCGASMLWCIAQGGPDWTAAAGGLRKEYAEVELWRQWFAAHGRLTSEPAPRRLVWYDWAGTPKGANHIGLVKSVSGRTMQVYEGNHNNAFELVTREIDSQVMGFGEWWSYIKQPAAVDDSCWMG